MKNDIGILSIVQDSIIILFIFFTNLDLRITLNNKQMELLKIKRLIIRVEIIVT